MSVVPIYTPMEVERMAWESLRFRPDIPFQAPINVERLILNLYPKVDILYELGLAHGYRVEGCVCKEFMSRTITVVIDRQVMSSSWDGYNRVLGEEYAHIQLHPFLFEVINSIDDFVAMQSNPEWERMEGDVRRFSRAIRMPPTLVGQELEHLYPQVVNEIGFESAEAIENRINVQMAAVFRVSPKEMMRRIADPPCNLRNQVLNSIQSRSPYLLESGWTVRALPPGAQMQMFETSGW